MKARGSSVELEQSGSRPGGTRADNASPNFLVPQPKNHEDNYLFLTGRRVHVITTSYHRRLNGSNDEICRGGVHRTGGSLGS